MSAEGLRQSRKRLHNQIETRDEHINSETPDHPLNGELSVFKLQTDGSHCIDCRKIDFRSLLSTPKRKMRPCCGIAVADLGQRDASWGRAACSLCRLFAAVRVPSQNFNNQYHLRALSFLKSYPEVVHGYPNYTLRDADTICFVVVPGNSTRRHSNQQCSISSDILACEREGYICPVDISSSTCLPMFGGRFIGPDQPDYGLLREWVGFCQKRHSRACTVGPKPHSSLFRLIECESRSIIRAPTDCQYIALSYVWGTKKPVSSETSTLENIFADKLPNTVSRVIEDAILATKKLGWQYLWVDRFCIDQHDQKIKDEQINTMDEIYRGAVLTIIAAAGLDDNLGLPGVGDTPRKPQPYTAVGETPLVSLLCHPELLIRDSKWATRAWTYQEGVLSTRRLVFTKEQIYFECRSMHCCEAVQKPLALLHLTRGQQGLRANVRRGYFESYSGLNSSRFYNNNPDHIHPEYNKFAELRSHLERYTARELSYESDSMIAFNGILREYARQEPRIDHYWGLPINHPRVDSPPFSAFTVSLAWIHTKLHKKRPAHRRYEFPSFSWAGWDGIATLPDSELYPAFIPSLTFFPDSETSLSWNLCGLRGPPGGDANLSNLPPYLHVGAVIFQIQLIKIPEIVGVNMEHHQLYQRGFQLANAGKMIDARLDLSVLPLANDQTHEALRTKFWDCIVLGDSLEVFGMLIMLIEWKGDIAERIGIAQGGHALREYVRGRKQKRRRIKLG